MFILQIADMHIGSAEKCSDGEENIVRKVVEYVKEKVPKNERLLLVVCGDLIDSAPIEEDKQVDSIEAINRFKYAWDILKIFFDELRQDYLFNIKICIGNHDITHMEEFEKSIPTWYGNTEDLESYKNVYSVLCEKENTEFLFINSCHDGDYKKGTIPYEYLSDLLLRNKEYRNKVFVLHHTIMSMDDNDNSSIRNAAELVNLIDKHSVSLVLHGHTHGQNVLTLGSKGCNVVGIGALFSRDFADVNSQFNLVEFSHGQVIDVQNITYHHDRKSDPFDSKVVKCTQKINYISGSNFETVYMELIERLTAFGSIYNMCIEIENEFNNFSKELHTFLDDEKLGEYTYFDLARLWEEQGEDKDSPLYFSHGQFFNPEDRKGIDYIIKELSQKNTSSRAVISTVNTYNILNIKSDGILPSLMSVQFSKDDAGIMYVNMSLRALEVSRFLKINICEVLYLLNKVKEKICFEKVHISIHAFRVQIIDDFSCFLKSKIDINYSSARLMKMLNGKKYKEVVALLEDKKSHNETIINITGIKELYEALTICCEGEREENVKTEKEAMKYVNELIILYSALKEYREGHSVVDSSIKEYERRIRETIDSICNLLKQSCEED